MPDRYSYLLLLTACLLVTLPLELALGARVYRRPLRTLVAVLPAFAVFALWDMAAASRGHWWFSRRYTLGWQIGGLPVEEWLFFAVIPVCALLTYEAVGRVLRRRRRHAL